VLEELGGPQAVHPIPNSFDPNLENQEFSCTFLSTDRGDGAWMHARWTQGRSVDGSGSFSARRARPLGAEPAVDLQPIQAYQDQAVIERSGSAEQQKRGVVDWLADTLSDDDPQHPER
jgi:hypothetical protein